MMMRNGEIVRDKSGYYTHSISETETELSKTGLCDSCGQRDTCAVNLKRKQGRTRDAYQVISVLACEVFVPRITLAAPLPKGGWNIMLLGNQAKYYLSHERILAVDDSDESIAMLKIEGVISMDREKAIERYGHRNYKVKDSEITRKQKQESLIDALKQQYDRVTWAREYEMTVIGVRQLAKGATV